MIKIFSGIFTIAAAAILISLYNGVESRSGGIVIGATGAPKVGGGNEGTCAGCHQGTVNSGPNSVQVSVLGNPAGFEPGQTYSMTAKIVSSGAVTAGFSVTCLNPALGNIGTFTTGTGTRIVNDPQSGRFYINHNTPGNGTWNFSWTAPTQNVPDSVTFFAVGRVSSPANNVYTSKFVFKKNITTSVDPFDSEKKIRPYPNPAADKIIFSKEPVTYVIRTLHGVEKQSGTAEGGESVSLQGFSSGIYFWEAVQGNQRFTGQFAIR